MFTNAEFSQLAERYMDMIFRLAYSYLKNSYDADDVTQNVLLRLLKTNKTFESEAHLKNWLVRVTVNQCKNVFRAPWRRDEPLEDYEATLVFERPAYSDLFHAVMNLDKKYRICLMLYYYEDYSIREIARVLHLSEKAVESRLHRARLKLKTLLTEVS